MPIQNVEKNLAGAEDLQLGAGTINQSRNGQIVVISKVNASKIPYSGDVATGDFLSIAAKIAAEEALLDQTIIDYQAADAAIVTSLDEPTIARKSSDIGVIYLPSGTSAERPVLANGVKGIRYNTDLVSFEGGIGTAGPTTWGSLGGGATGGNTDKVFQENEMIVTTNYTITAGKSASSVGGVSGITINNGITVTVPDGARWVVL